MERPPLRSWTPRWLAACVALLVLAPAATALQDETKLNLGRELTRMFYEREIVALWEMFSPEMRAQLQSEETFAGFREQVEGQLGAEIELLDEGVTQDQGQDVYTRVAKFANSGETLIEVVFVTGGTGAVTGFWIRPAASQPSPVSSADEDDMGAASAQHDGVRSVVTIRPTAVSAEGRDHLVYELRLINRRDQAVTLTGIDVVTGSTDRPLTTLRDQALQAAHGGSTPEVEISPGNELLLYLWVSATRAPGSMRHRIHLRDAAGDELTVAGPVLTPQSSSAVAIGPPLSGGNWLAANGPSPTSGHRRARIEVDGERFIAQRFAIDFLQLREGATHEGAAEDNANYHAWGQEALAVASATVVDLKDGIPENVPGLNSRAVEITLETIAGNYVILDLGDGNFAFYAHLQPGSLRVELGQQVQRGDVLGLVGNSGNSTEPHLHFHVSDRASPLGAVGLPYVFDTFRLQGNAAANPDSIVAPGEAETRTLQMPLENAVVAFE